MEAIPIPTTTALNVYLLNDGASGRVTACLYPARPRLLLTWQKPPSALCPHRECAQRAFRSQQLFPETFLGGLLLWKLKALTALSLFLPQPRRECAKL